MSEILIFGHKNPDTDSICSSLVMQDFERKMGNDNVVACRLGMLNKETEYILNYVNIEAPRLIEDAEDGTEVIIVDTSNPNELIPNLENVKIKKIVDHHQVLINTSYPIFYRTEPVGCTETIMYKLYKENGLKIDKNIAILMLSAIISDTLLLKSPTCTQEDKKAVEELSLIADIDYNKYGMEMLKAGTDLSSFSIEQILSIDAKAINLKNVKSIIAQVNTASIPEVMDKKNELENAMKKIIAEKDLDLFLFLITDIINSNSQVIAIGNRADLVEKAYKVELNDNTAFLEGIVSRKKQVVPILTENA